MVIARANANSPLLGSLVEVYAGVKMDFDAFKEVGPCDYGLQSYRARAMRSRASSILPSSEILVREIEKEGGLVSKHLAVVKKLVVSLEKLVRATSEMDRNYIEEAMGDVQGSIDSLRISLFAG